MKFKELLHQVSWDDVEKYITDYYYEDENDQATANMPGYQSVFNELHFMKPIDTKMRICLNEVTPDMDDSCDEPYIIVDGKDGTLNKESSDFECWGPNVPEEVANAEQSFGIEFAPWCEWLGMEIDAETINTYTPVEIVANCLFEMTYMGYSEDKIQGELNMLNERVNEIKNMTEEEKKTKLMSLDEFEKKLGYLNKKDDNNDEIQDLF